MAAANIVDPIANAEHALAAAKQNAKTTKENAVAADTAAETELMGARKDVVDLNKQSGPVYDAAIVVVTSKEVERRNIAAAGLKAIAAADEVVRAAQTALRWLLMMKMQHKQELKAQKRQLTEQFAVQEHVYKKCITKLQQEIDDYANEKKRDKEKECDDKFNAEIAALQAQIASLE
jgi:hypothetical protein